MKFNHTNAEEINSPSVYVHDEIYDSLCFDRKEKTLKLLLISWNGSKPKETNYSITFENIAGYEVSTCDFWGKSMFIYDMEYVPINERVLFPRLVKRWKDIYNETDVFANGVSYIEILVTFHSGDELRVVCEDLIVE